MPPGKIILRPARRLSAADSIPPLWHAPRVIRIRKSEERGRTRLDWLDSRHTFSFGGYHDPRHKGFRRLLVINEDRVKPDRGFEPHPHREMEILTYVLEGALEHRDSLGTGSVIGAGDVQRISAGTGIVHSEFNPSTEDPLHFLQVWIVPERRGLEPSYEQLSFDAEDKRDRFRLVATPGGGQGALTLQQDGHVLASLLEPGHTAGYTFSPGRHGWLQVAQGVVELNGNRLNRGDGAAMSHEPQIEVCAVESAEILLFDLA